MKIKQTLHVKIVNAWSNYGVYNYRDSLLPVSDTLQYMHTIPNTVSNECNESLIRNVLGNANWLYNVMTATVCTKSLL